MLMHVVVAAARALDAIRPAITHKVRAARFLIGKHALELGYRKLVNLLGFMGSFHAASDVGGSVS
jgi:hypothetical protein